MRCPKCRGDTKVVHTATYHRGRLITKSRNVQPALDMKIECVVRIRKCLNRLCAQRFQTAEVPID